MVTLICTTFNCANEIQDSIEYFLNKENVTLFDELIICDGGSIDGTMDLLNKFTSLSNKIKIINAPGANISRGRNIAINEANSEIIVVFDSGTIYSKAWLQKMIEPIRSNKCDIVEGNSILVGKNRFQKIICNLIDNSQEKLPQGSSHRCISYKKLVWETIGGYPENVRAGEDTWFNSMARRMNFRINYDKTAVCYWEVRKNFSSYLKMIFRNVRGHISLDGNLGTLKLKFMSLINCVIILGFMLSFLSKYILIAMTILSLIYFAYRLLKPPRYKFFSSPINFILGTIIIFMSDLTISMAFINKLTSNKYNKYDGNHNNDKSI